ncbi:hypothetical protein Btru_019438 [Bulinus truncatus]|nr:hypothetical protein Btru_019438 [Bulinus truncatus]
MEWEEVKKSLWHAFDVLDTTSHLKKTRTALVPKTKLRVLTNNLGHLLNVEQAETIWDKIQEDNIDFNQFMDVLNKNLLVGLDKHSGAKLVSLMSDIDNLCWMLCENVYRQRILEEGVENGENHSIVTAENKIEDKLNLLNIKPAPKIFSSSDCFKLWKIFNFLVERAEDKSLLFPLLTDIEEAERIAVEICQAVGLSLPKTELNQRRGSIDSVLQSFLIDFSDFVKLIVKRIIKDNDTRAISHGISEVYNQVMYDVVRKGNMVKFGNKVTAWKERWFVLTSCDLKYYTNAEEKDLKGSINLCPACFIQSFPDKPGGKQHRFKLHTPGKHYELSTLDLRSKNEWMGDIKTVISYIGKSKDSLQLSALKERKKEREERRRRTAEEELNRCAEREKLLERERELEEERKQRQLAEEEIKERERLLALERQKRAEEEDNRRRETDKLLSDKEREIAAERQSTEVPMSHNSSASTEVPMSHNSSASTKVPMSHNSSASTEVPMSHNSSASTEVPMSHNSSASTEVPMSHNSSASTEVPMSHNSSASTEVQMSHNLSASTEVPMSNNSSASTEVLMSHFHSHSRATSEKLPEHSSGAKWAGQFVREINRVF